jgi:hypothetical protein
MYGLCNPHEITVRRTETKSRLGVIIEVSSPFWPITALAISVTSGAAGLSPFADPLNPTGPASLGRRSVTPLRFDAQFEIPAKQKKVVEKDVEEMGIDVDKHA